MTNEKPFLELHREAQLLIMSLSFVICWAPFGFVYLVKLLGFRDKDSRQKADVLTLLCVKLVCGILNPLIYSFEDNKVGSSTII